jgi:hypothetical protein
MSKFDKYKTPKNIDTHYASDERSSVFDKYRSPKSIPKEVSPALDRWWGEKAALKGAMDLIDAPTNLANLGETGIKTYLNKTGNMLRKAAGKEPVTYNNPNFFSEENMPRVSTHIKSLAKDKGIDLEPRYNNKSEQLAGELIGIATSGGLFGKLSKGAKALEGAKTAVKLDLGSKALQQSGLDPLYADIAINLSPNVASKAANIIKHPKEKIYYPLGRKILGLTPDKLDSKALKAARDLGIDLPAAAVTDSNLTGLADQWLQKTPVLGHKLKNKYITTQEQIKRALEDIFNKTGPSRTPEIEAQIAGLYDRAEKSLPLDAKVLPANLKKAIDEIKINTAILSPDEKSLLQSLETIKNEIEPASKIISQYGPIKLPLQAYDVNKLVGTKKSLNSIIKWDTDAGVKKQLKKIQKAISQDIKEYGNSNPEWYQTFKGADKLYGNVAKREKLENILGHKGTNWTFEDLKYNALAKAINDPKNFKIIKKQLTPEANEQVQKLGTVAKAMALKNSRIPNPSGTAITASTLGLIGGVYANPLLALSGSGVGTVGGGLIARDLLTNKKFLDSSLQNAEKQATKLPFKQRYYNEITDNLRNNSPLILTREANRF